MRYLIINYDMFTDLADFDIVDTNAKRGSEDFEEMVEGYNDCHSNIIVCDLNEKQIKKLDDLTKWIECLKVSIKNKGKTRKAVKKLMNIRKTIREAKK